MSMQAKSTCMHIGQCARQDALAQTGVDTYPRSIAEAQADIFSYGVILWEIVTHEEPHRGCLRDCKVPHECPAVIDQLMNQCLSHEPDDRPSAKEICDQIRQWRETKEGEVREARSGRQRLY